MSKSRDLSKIAGISTFGYKSMQVFATPGTYTWTKPAGITRVRVIVTGGGAGGGSTNDDDMAGGGGAGATAIKTIDVSSVSTVSVTVGAGLAGFGNNSSNAVSYGNSSSFGTYCTAGGGSNSGGAWAIGGYGGTASGGDINIPGGDGAGGFIDQTWTYVPGGLGGSSYWGSGGTGDSRNSYSGRAGRAYGSGGGGGSLNRGSYAGAGGIVVVEEYV